MLPTDRKKCSDSPCHLYRGDAVRESEAKNASKSRAAAATHCEVLALRAHGQGGHQRDGASVAAVEGLGRERVDVVAIRVEERQREQHRLGIGGEPRREGVTAGTGVGGGRARHRRHEQDGEHDAHGVWTGEAGGDSGSSRRYEGSSTPRGARCPGAVSSSRGALLVARPLDHARAARVEGAARSADRWGRGRRPRARAARASARDRAAARPRGARACTGGEARRRAPSRGACSTILPRYITATRWLTCSTTLRSCDTNRYARPSVSCSSTSRLTICAWIDTSSALIGSSHTMNSRLDRERAGDADALPLPAGELVRVAVHRVGAHPDLRRAARRCGPPRRRASSRACGRGWPRPRSRARSCAGSGSSTGPGR